MREKIVLFGKERSLVGIITDPPKTEKDDNLPAIIFLNSGIIHRVGPNRFTVKMARDLADMGFVSLRMDYSEIGESKPGGEVISIIKRWTKEGQEAIISFIRGDSKLVRKLVDLRLTPGVKITVTQGASPDGSMEIVRRGSRLSLDAQITFNVFVNKPDK